MSLKFETGALYVDGHWVHHPVRVEKCPEPTLNCRWLGLGWRCPYCRRFTQPVTVRALFEFTTPGGERMRRWQHSDHFACEPCGWTRRAEAGFVTAILSAALVIAFMAALIVYMTPLPPTPPPTSPSPAIVEAIAP